MNNILRKNERGSLIVISGPSGSGKDTICERLKEYKRDFGVSVSCTTRKPRKGEEEGINYFFLTEEEFKNNIKENKFIEYAKYNGNYYGTLKDKVNEHLSNGIDVILVIEVQGALEIKHKIPESIFIFIMPPTMKELILRLKKRGTESHDVIIERFKKAYKEINELNKYNYVVVNDEIDKALLGYDLTNLERSHIFNLIDNEINGYGPITELLEDPNITEIMVNGKNEVYVEIDGQISKDDSVSFINDEHIIRTVQKIVQPLGRTIDTANPMVDARLEDGSML